MCDTAINNTPLYSSIVISALVEYINEHYPDIDINSAMDYARITRYEIGDDGHWFNQDQVDRFYEILIQKTGNTNIAREAGRYIVFSKMSGILRQYAMGFTNPKNAYLLFEKVVPLLTKCSTFSIRKSNSHKVEIISTPVLGVIEKPYQCANRVGILESLSSLFTKGHQKVRHPTCIHMGGNQCVYVVTWKTPHSVIWNRIRNYVTLLSLITLPLLYFIFPGLSGPALILLFSLPVMMVFLYCEHIEKKELTRNINVQSNTAYRLLEQTRIRSNEALLIREIGEVASMTLDISDILKLIMEALGRRLDFDRGMIMLANDEKTRLIYTAGFGLNQVNGIHLENLEFHLDNPHSKGTAVKAFKQQKPFLINDIAEIKGDFSKRSLEFIQRAGTQSFACIPIAYKGEAMGVLMVDRFRSKEPLNQGDMNLLIGIAPQIAITINNASYYQKMRESEERFRSLSENAPDIIFTLDNNGAFTYVNPAWERILGYSAHETKGRYFVDFIRKDDSLNYIQLFKQIKNEKRPFWDLITTMSNRDQKKLYFSMNVSPNLDMEGNFNGLAGILRDITELTRSETELKSSLAKLQTALDNTIQTISMIVEMRDPYTSGHQQRVARLACAIAEEMKLSEEETNAIHMAAALHDIGKINVPVEILSSPRRLNEFEFGMIKMHPEVGYNILKTIDFPYAVAEIAYQHHERMDGSGYPRGISGDDITTGGRILAVSDVVEAMAFHRPYRPALGIDKALTEISQNKGTAYDPDIVDACVALFSEKKFEMH